MLFFILLLYFSCCSFQLISSIQFSDHLYHNYLPGYFVVFIGVVNVVLQIPYFEDVGVITLQYLDMLVQRDNLQKSQFFKGLPKVIEKLPLVSPSIA